MWREARRETEAAKKRASLAAVILGPLSFAALAALSRVQCPLPMDFVVLAAFSGAMMTLWMAIAEQCRGEAVRAERGAAAASEALGCGAASGPESTAAGGRALRIALAMALAALWFAAWNVRPDCASGPAEESEMTRSRAAAEPHPDHGPLALLGPGGCQGPAGGRG
jgi:hypothetical protein